MRVISKVDTDKFEVGDNIRIRREELKFSQNDLADLLGSTRKMVSKYETGNQEMGINAFIQYCDALNVKPEQLFPKRFRERGDNSKAAQLAELSANLPEEDIDCLIQLALRLARK